MDEYLEWAKSTLDRSLQAVSARVAATRHAAENFFDVTADVADDVESNNAVRHAMAVEAQNAAIQREKALQTLQNVKSEFAVTKAQYESETNEDFAAEDRLSLMGVVVDSIVKKVEDESDLISQIQRQEMKQYSYQSKMLCGVELCLHALKERISRHEPFSTEVEALHRELSDLGESTVVVKSLEPIAQEPLPSLQKLQAMSNRLCELFDREVPKEAQRAATSYSWWQALKLKDVTAKEDDEDDRRAETIRSRGNDESVAAVGSAASMSKAVSTTQNKSESSLPVGPQRLRLSARRGNLGDVISTSQALRDKYFGRTPSSGEQASSGVEAAGEQGTNAAAASTTADRSNTSEDAIRSTIDGIYQGALRRAMVEDALAYCDAVVATRTVALISNAFQGEKKPQLPPNGDFSS